MKALRIVTFFCVLALMPILAFGAKININTASAQTLQRLDGIGPSKAQAIIDYREHNNGFQTLADVTKVRGVGEHTLDVNRERIILQ